MPISSPTVIKSSLLPSGTNTVPPMWALEPNRNGKRPLLDFKNWEDQSKKPKIKKTSPKDADSSVQTTTMEVSDGQTPPNSMITVILNARGLRGQRAFHSICHLIYENSPDLIFILNLNCVSLMLTSLALNLIFDIASMWTLWNENIDVSILSYSLGHIDYLIFSSDSPFYQFLW